MIFLNEHTLVHVRLIIQSMRERGITIRAEGSRILAAPAELIAPSDKSAIAADREVFLTVLRLGECPNCHKILDEKGRCWKCFERRCARCPGMTGSAFIELCFKCGFEDSNRECEQQEVSA